jgi:hypothetical protein
MNTAKGWIALAAYRSPSTAARAHTPILATPLPLPQVLGTPQATCDFRSGPAGHRRPQDFAQIRVTSDKSQQELDFSVIPRGNRSWGRNRGKLQLVGGLKTWN